MKFIIEEKDLPVYYLTRGGDIATIDVIADGTTYCFRGEFKDTRRSWTINGAYGFMGDEHPMDLVMRVFITKNPELFI